MEEGKKSWLKNIKGSWRDVICPCGSTFHFDGSIDALFSWETIHIRHMSFDSENHDMLSFYPKDMVIFYHSKSGYVVERRRHTDDEIRDLQTACIYGTAKLAGV
ncbi:MAG: hypothetical protein WBY28_10620 [Nitrososphaeraceae archaeon]